MQNRRRRYGFRALGALLILTFLATAPALARTKKTGYVDDDWEPVERGRSYLDDPGYEFWIMEALDLAGVQYDVYEVQLAGNPAQLPTLADLGQYPLVLWDCAAETEGAMAFDERQLLRGYRDLGGKVVLLGQGILNSLAAQLDEDPGNPEILEFLNQQMGVQDSQLDVWVEQLLPPIDVPYLASLSPLMLDYTALPDPSPAFADVAYPMPGVDAFIQGQLVTGEIEPVSTDRYLPAATHFQSVMPEAIADAQLRADWLLALMEWLGYEGDELLDFMHDSDFFAQVSSCPPSLIDWSPLLNAMAFEVWGSTWCPTVWEMDLVATEPDCPWRLGFSHLIQSITPYSEMVLMELANTSYTDFIYVRAQADSGNPLLYDLSLMVQAGGSPILSSTVTGLNVDEIYRTHLILHSGTTGLELQVMDRYGTVLGGFTIPSFAPNFSKLRIRSEAHDFPVNGPTMGWIDDYFIEGCLSTGPTASGEIPTPRPLLSAHPNPFNPSTRISVDLPRSGHVTVTLHDMAGRRLRTLANGWREAGNLDLEWDGRDEAGRRLGSGVYLLRLGGEAGQRAAKLVMVK